MKKPEPTPESEINFEIEGKQIIEILQDKNVMSQLFEIEKDYPYWENFKYKVKPLTDYDSKFLWKIIKMQRRQSFSGIEISKIGGFDFRYNTNSKILEHLHHFDLYLGGVLEGEIIPSEDKNRYLISSIMEEAIASSQLEGAATTREVAKEMLRTNRKPRNISERMILNNYQTIKRILEIKEKKLSPQLILEIHSIISKDTLEKKDNEGRFRQNDDVRVEDATTGEVFYFPPNYTKIEGLIEDLCEFANSDNDSGFIHPIVRGIILHFLIGYIHPFVDGNGRTARALFYWFLISKGYWLIEYLSISRIMVQSPSQYARAYLFTEYDDNDLTYFIDFNLRAMELALKNLQNYIKRKIDDKQRMYKFIKNENFNERQADLIGTLMTDSQRVLTIKEVEIKYDIVYQTARLDLLGLEEMGYLKSKNVGKKLVFYVVDDFDSKIRKLSKI